MKTAIVTGCAGLLGSHFSRHLINNGYKVIGIDDLSGGYKEYLPTQESNKFSFYEFNLSWPLGAKIKLNDIFEREKPIVCFHFAAYAAEGVSPFIRHFNYTNNILSSVQIINACINHDVKLVFTSSMAVYGDQPSPFNEQMNPRPIDPYGIAKYAIEQDIKVAAEQHGLRYTIIRPHNVIGIYQNIWDKYRNVAGIFIRKALSGEPILIYGDGEQTRAFSDIKYYMKPFEKLIYSYDNEMFNIGADKTYTINQLANTVESVAKSNGFEVEKIHAEPRHEVKHAYCDHSKAKQILDFSDDTDLEITINDMFRWAMEQPVRQQKIMQYEVEKGIYEYWK